MLLISSLKCSSYLRLFALYGFDKGEFFICLTSYGFIYFMIGFALHRIHKLVLLDIVQLISGEATIYKFNRSRVHSFSSVDANGNECTKISLI